MYNFRFNCAAPPGNRELFLALFKPGEVVSIPVSAIGPDFDCNANNIGDTIDIADGTSTGASNRYR